MSRWEDKGLHAPSETFSKEAEATPILLFINMAKKQNIADKLNRKISVKLEKIDEAVFKAVVRQRKHIASFDEISMKMFDVCGSICQMIDSQLKDL